MAGVGDPLNFAVDAKTQGEEGDKAISLPAAFGVYRLKKLHGTGRRFSGGAVP